MLRCDSDVVGRGRFNEGVVLGANETLLLERLLERLWLGLGRCPWEVEGRGGRVAFLVVVVVVDVAVVGREAVTLYSNVSDVRRDSTVVVGVGWGGW